MKHAHAVEDRESVESDESAVPCGQTFVESEVPNSSSSNNTKSIGPKGDSEDRNVNSRQLDEILSRLTKLEKTVNILKRNFSTPTKSSQKHKTFGSAQKGELVDKNANASYLYGRCPNFFN